MKFLEEVVFQLFGREVKDKLGFQPVGGGCIHQAGTFLFEKKRFFIKWNKEVSTMFKTEAMGLHLLKNTRTIRVPEVVGYGNVDNLDFLCLEYKEKGVSTGAFWESFGHGMAQLHQNTADQFGLDHDNFIGSLPQTNQWHESWVEFFIHQRLEPQVRMARDRQLLTGQLIDQFDALYTKLGELIPIEVPALLHGDLWSGNFLVGSEGQPVIFDPAVFYGHREAEIAFTKMFGGFDLNFYGAYEEVFAPQPGHEGRVELFNLYPLLVHVNLFGSSYLSGVEATLRRFT